MKFLRKIIYCFLLLVVLLILVYFIFFSRKYPITLITHSFYPGDSLDSWHGVVVYNNGAEYANSYGKNYSPDSFYYGKKWQCVEFVKRYYHDHLNFIFRDGMGHAKQFFDQRLKQGELNKRRGMIQFINGGNERPKVDDILIFDGEFGHVAIVTSVEQDAVNVIQQNIFMTPRQQFLLTCLNGKYTVGEGRRPMGWLRRP